MLRAYPVQVEEMNAKSRRKRQSGNGVVSRFDEGVVFAQADLKTNIAHVDPYFWLGKFARNWLGLAVLCN